MNLIQSVKNQLGELDKVKWRRSRHNGKFVFVSIQSASLPCVCKSTHQLSVGVLNDGLEMLGEEVRVEAHNVVRVYQDSGLVRHERCGEVIGSIEMEYTKDDKQHLKMPQDLVDSKDLERRLARVEQILENLHHNAKRFRVSWFDNERQEARPDHLPVVGLSRSPPSCGF